MAQVANELYAEAPHFWFEMLTKYLFFVTLIDNLRRLPFIMTIGRLIAPLTSGVQAKNAAYTRELVNRSAGICSWCAVNANSGQAFTEHL